jgi:hypothetical protein
LYAIDQSPEGAAQIFAPSQGFVSFECKTQGGARASLALGWLVAAPLVLHSGL